MAIGTYTELQALIKARLSRADLDLLIPDFIALFEAQANREIRTREMEERSTNTLTGAYIDVPDDYLELRNVQINTSPAKRLQLVSPEALDRTFRSTDSGVPAVYTVIGTQFQFAPVPDSTYQIEIAYYARIPSLSSLNPTNWLLTLHPDIYMYGAMLQAEAHIKNDKRLATWGAAYANALASLKRHERDSRFSGSAMMPRITTRVP